MLFVWCTENAVVEVAALLHSMDICCVNCDMSFPSRHLLSKHQAQFCVGPSSVELSHLQPDIDRLQVSVMKLQNLFCLDYYVLIICSMLYSTQY